MEDQVHNLRAILLMFEAISSLEVNLKKSKIMGVGSVPNLENLVDLLGYLVYSLLGTYLGLLLGTKYNFEDDIGACH